MLLIGDAAAYLDPSSGRGILNALRSASSAVHAVVQQLRGDKTVEAAQTAHFAFVRQEFLATARALRDAYLRAGIDVDIPEVK